MYRQMFAVALIALAAPASAADRTYMVTDFDRIRVEGPFEVQLIVGDRSSSGKATGDDKALASLDVSVQSGILVIRKAAGSTWADQKASGQSPVVTVTTRQLRSASVISGGRLTVSGKLSGDRLDVQITGNASIDARGIDTDTVTVTLIGGGSAALSGRTAHARLIASGAGTIAATPLDAGDLLARLEGFGEIRASARYTADLSSKGLGRITVAGNAKCTIRGQEGGPIQCGAAPAN